MMNLRNFSAVACMLLQLAVPAISKEEQTTENHFPGTASALSGLKKAVYANVGSNILQVHLDRITNLGGEDVGSKSEVYAILEVEQDNWTVDHSFGEQTSKVVEDLNPVFNEDFEWLLPDLENMVLKVGVWDWDTGFDDKMGDAEIKLDDLRLSATPKEVQATVDHHVFGGDAVAYFTIAWKTPSSPTNPPIKPPTNRPTKAPTKPPTSPPTNRPTNPPTIYCHPDGYKCGHDKIGTGNDTFGECKTCCNAPDAKDEGAVTTDHYCKCLPAKVKCGSTLITNQFDRCDKCCNPGKDTDDGFTYDDHYCK